MASGEVLERGILAFSNASCYRPLYLGRIVRPRERAPYKDTRLDGCEALIPGLFQLCHRSAEHGVERVQLGMAHRGRLNVLSNLLGKPMGLICAEMRENISEFHVGDVKYHLGITGTLPMRDVGVDPMSGVESSVGSEASDAGPLTLQIVPNPSHLEAVVPVVLGQVRALQDTPEGGGSEIRKVDLQ